MAEAEGIAGLDTSVAHPARVYDYWLGGSDNFAADREAAERVLAAAPGLRYRVRANRAFLGRATRYLAVPGERAAGLQRARRHPADLAHPGAGGQVLHRP
jgi:S-adenosyl methyltransferase